MFPWSGLRTLLIHVQFFLKGVKPFKAATIEIGVLGQGGTVRDFTDSHVVDGLGTVGSRPGRRCRSEESSWSDTTQLPAEESQDRGVFLWLSVSLHERRVFLGQPCQRTSACGEWCAEAVRGVILLEGLGIMGACVPFHCQSPKAKGWQSKLTTADSLSTISKHLSDFGVSV